MSSLQISWWAFSFLIKRTFLPKHNIQYTKLQTHAQLLQIERPTSFALSFSQQRQQGVRLDSALPERRPRDSGHCHRQEDGRQPRDKAVPVLEVAQEPQAVLQGQDRFRVQDADRRVREAVGVGHGEAGRRADVPSADFGLWSEDCEYEAKWKVAEIAPRVQTWHNW